MTDTIKHKDDLPWWVAPLPPRWHTCFPQTTGWTDWVTYVERCACGAIRSNHGRWYHRNERQEKREVGRKVFIGVMVFLAVVMVAAIVYGLGVALFGTLPHRIFP
jgi:hypothetical protein